MTPLDDDELEISEESVEDLEPTNDDDVAGGALTEAALTGGCAKGATIVCADRNTI